MVPPIVSAAILLAIFGGIAYSLYRMWRFMRATLTADVSEEDYLPHTCESCGRGMKEIWQRCPACATPSEDYSHRKLLMRLRAGLPEIEVEPVPPVEGETIVSVLEATDGEPTLALWIDQFSARGIWCQEKINVVYMPRGGRVEHHHLMVREVDTKRARRLIRFYKKRKGQGDGK